MQCFECETTENLHHHHVVPRSLGGTKTIPLCGRCHGLVHSRDVMSTGALTSKAMKAKRAKGEYTGGRVPYGYSVDADGVTLVPNPTEIEVILCAQELRRDGYSSRGISAELAARGMMNRAGEPFASKVVLSLLAEKPLSLRTIAAELATRGMLTRGGRPFDHKAIPALLDMKPPSLRKISAELAERGMMARNGQPFPSETVKCLLSANVEGVA